MILNLERTVSRFASPKTLLILFGLALPLMLWVFPWRRAQLVAFSGLAEPTFDVRIGYSASDLLAALPAYGLQGRQLYALSELTLDFLFPLLYAPFLFGSLLWLFQRVFPPQSGLQRLAYLPLGIWAADLLENASLAWVLLAYPQVSVGVAWTASLFSFLKWVLAGVMALLLAGGLLSLGLGALRRPRRIRP